MAIGYTLVMKDSRLTEEILFKKLEDMGCKCDNVEKLRNGVSLSFEDNIGFTVYLTNSRNYPYNIWETELLEDDFTSEKVLEFRIDKDYPNYEERYMVIFTIIFDLMRELMENAILFNNSNRELCFFGADTTVLLNSKAEIWNQNLFKDFLVNRDIRYRVK